MKRILLLFIVLYSTNCFCQIYFSPNTDMYVKNEVLYVQQNINLAGNSNLYLRNNSQLLQGTTTTSANLGTGTLSVYQEGTSDNFDYNYWCSPVGNPTAISGNENFGITMLNRPTTSTASTPAVVLAAGTYDGISNPLSIASSWIYKLVNANNYSQWIFVGGASTLAAGQGFTMKGTSGTDTANPEGTGITNNPGSAQRYDFRGKPNDGNIVITLGINNATLTGNPYPSALNLNAFLLDGSNAATGGVAYFWQEDKTVNSHYLSAYRGGYGTFSPINPTSDGVFAPAVFKSYNQDGSINTGSLGSGIAVQRKFSPIGQGFLINATANGTATFKNTHRAFYKEGAGLSQFEKHAGQGKEEKEANEKEEEEAPVVSIIRINSIINDQFTRQLALAFLSDATDGVDLGIDAKNMDGSLPSDVTFWLDNASYVIQGLTFDPSKKIALTVKATENTTFKFSIPEVTDFDASQPIYIYDTLDNSYHDVKNGSYLVTVPAGVYADRFKITFTSQSLGTPETALKQFNVYQDNSNSLLRADNPENLSFKSFKLYDILGKAVISKKELGTNSNYSFSTSGLSLGIYIAEFITNDNEKLTQKVFISNSGK